MPNRLAAEPSPYLRQHADNPVDWYPWGPEALERARAERKPILLSIGYAACHWCHVMAHESFEDPATAEVMNRLFINIKVDREERPDLDSIHMQAVQAMTGHGGWPMTVFLTPEGAPFWGGTYFPPDDRTGMPSFRRVLAHVAESFATRADDVERAATTMRELLENSARALPPGDLTRQTLARAFEVADRTFDEKCAGFGGAPKFPPTMLLEFLLAHWARTGEPRALTLAQRTFAHMAAGGIHDHVGGGFHRYTVDRTWLVPHFEKMLYDNALLARFGAHLWQATHDASVRATTERVLEWIAAEMTSDEGGFFASLDADSEGHEGLYYTWTPSELDAALGADAAPLREWYGVTDGGNFEGRNILSRIEALAAAEAAAEGAANAAAGSHAATFELPPPNVARALVVLGQARARRVRPSRDDKAIAAWNGLMLRGVVACARAFRSERWRSLALRNATFLVTHLARDGEVMRIRAGGESRIPGFLEDYAAVALAFLDVWELTSDRSWFDRARALGDAMLARFWDDSIAGFYDTPHDHEPLVMRPRDQHDNAAPSGHSLAAELLLKLGYVTGDNAYSARALATLAPQAETMARHPHAFGHALTVADALVNGVIAIATVGTPAGIEELAAPVVDRFLPGAIVAGGTVADGDLALFANRTPEQHAAAAWVCRGPTCLLPATTVDQVLDRLAELAAPRAAPFKAPTTPPAPPPHSDL